MKRKYILIPVLLLGGLLLAACATAATSTSVPAEANPDPSAPSEAPTSTVDAQEESTAESPTGSSAESTQQVSPSPTEAAVEPTAAAGDEPETEYEIITLLPFDAIPAIDDPQFLRADEADEQYSPDDLVMGVVFDGEARAYSVSHLSRHEIVNDTVAGRKIAVTW